MVDLRRWNWLWLLPCALLQFMPESGAAQPAPLTNAEAKCAFSAAQETVRHDEMFRRHFDETLRQIRAQHCPNGEQAAQERLYMMMHSLWDSVHHNVLTKCFSAVLQQPEAQQRLMQLSEPLYVIEQQAIYTAVPRPLCP